MISLCNYSLQEEVEGGTIISHFWPKPLKTKLPDGDNIIPPYPPTRWALTPLLPSPDPGSHRLPDGGVGGRFQPAGAEGGPAGRDGAVGGHPGCPLPPGTQPEGDGVAEGAAEVGAVGAAMPSRRALV